MLSPNTINALNQTVIWTFSVPNGATNNAGVSVVVTLPVGWAIQPGVVPSIGTFAGNTWTIGGMIANQVALIAIPVKNSTLIGSPWVFGAQVFGMDTNISNNQFTESITLTACDICPPAAGAVDDPFACLCGFANANDTPCTSGITSYTYEETSLINVVIDFWDDATSQYHVTPIDPLLPWQFTYSIWCENGGGPLQISGPALVSGPPQWLNYDKIPRLFQEDFNPLVAENTVTLSIEPILGFDIFVYRNGSILPKTDWSLSVNVVGFVTPFGASGGGLYGESVSVQFYKII